MDFRQMLAQSPAAMGQLSGFTPPNFGGTTPQRSVPLWFGGALPKGQGQGTAPWVSPQQNSYWPQILQLLQNPLGLPQSPSVQPLPQLPIPPGQQLPNLFPPGTQIPPNLIPPATPGMPPGTGTTLPPTVGTTPGSTPQPLPTPTPIPVPGVLTPKKAIVVKPKESGNRR